MSDSLKDTYARMLADNQATAQRIQRSAHEAELRKWAAPLALEIFRGEAGMLYGLDPERAAALEGSLAELRAQDEWLAPLARGALHIVKTLVDRQLADQTAQAAAEAALPRPRRRWGSGRSQEATPAAPARVTRWSLESRQEPAGIRSYPDPGIRDGETHTYTSLTKSQGIDLTEDGKIEEWTASTDEPRRVVHSYSFTTGDRNALPRSMERQITVGLARLAMKHRVPLEGM